MMRLPRSQYYHMKEWKDGRKEFLFVNPFCEICGAKATEVHHDYEYNHYYWTDEDFFNRNSWVALCSTCHSRITQQNRNLRRKEGLDY